MYKGFTMASLRIVCRRPWILYEAFCIVNSVLSIYCGVKEVVWRQSVIPTGVRDIPKFKPFVNAIQKFYSQTTSRKMYVAFNNLIWKTFARFKVLHCGYRKFCDSLLL